MKPRVCKRLCHHPSRAGPRRRPCPCRRRWFSSPKKTAPTRFTTTIIGGKEYTVPAVSNVVNAKMINTAVQRKDARSARWGLVIAKCLESVQPHFQAGVPLQAVQSPAQAFWSGGGASPFQSPAKLLWPGGGGGAAAFQNPAQAFWPGGGAAAFLSPAPYAAYSSGRSSPPLPQLPPFFATAPAAAAPPPVLTSVATYAISRATSTRGLRLEQGARLRVKVSVKRGHRGAHFPPARDAFFPLRDAFFR